MSLRKVTILRSDNVMLDEKSVLDNLTAAAAGILPEVFSNNHKSVEDMVASTFFVGMYSSNFTKVAQVPSNAKMLDAQGNVCVINCAARKDESLNYVASMCLGLRISNDKELDKYKIGSDGEVNVMLSAEISLQKKGDKSKSYYAFILIDFNNDTDEEIVFQVHETNRDDLYSGYMSDYWGKMQYHEGTTDEQIEHYIKPFNTLAMQILHEGEVKSMDEMLHSDDPEIQSLMSELLEPDSYKLRELEESGAIHKTPDSLN